MLAIILTGIYFAFWSFMLHIFKRANTRFFHFSFGSVGLFVMLVILSTQFFPKEINYIFMWPLRFVGDFTSVFYTDIDTSMLSIITAKTVGMTHMDYEYLGIIEIFSFLSIMTFIPLYGFFKKMLYGASGVLYILFFNMLRVLSVQYMYKETGVNAFGINVATKLFFYAAMVVLYYFTFTRPHIETQKVGR